MTNRALARRNSYKRSLITTVEPLPYSEFRRLLSQNEIAEVTISDNTIPGALKTPLKDGRSRFETTRVEGELADELSRYEVKYARIVENTFLRDILSWILPAVVFIGIWLFAMRRFGGQGGLGGGFMAVGKSRAKLYGNPACARNADRGRTWAPCGSRFAQARFNGFANIRHSNVVEATLPFLCYPSVLAGFALRVHRGGWTM